jgi:hypothetical protein
LPEGSDATIGPRLLCSPSNEFAQIGNLFSRELGFTMAAAGTAATRIPHDDDKVALIEIIGLLVAWTMRLSLLESYGEPVGPAKLAIPAIARGSQKHRQPLPSLIVLRKPDVHGNRYAVAHRYIQGGVSKES